MMLQQPSRRRDSCQSVVNVVVFGAQLQYFQIAHFEAVAATDNRFCKRAMDLWAEGWFIRESGQFRVPRFLPLAQRLCRNACTLGGILIV